MKFVLYLYLIFVLKSISVGGDDRDPKLALMMKNFKDMAKIDLWCCISHYGFIAPVASKSGLLTFSQEFRAELVDYIGVLYKDPERSPEELDNALITKICEKCPRWQNECLDQLKDCFVQFRKDLVEERRVSKTNRTYQQLIKLYKIITKRKKLKLKSKKSAVEPAIESTEEPAAEHAAEPAGEIVEED